VTQLVVKEVASYYELMKFCLPYAARIERLQTSLERELTVRARSTVLQ